MRVSRRRSIAFVVSDFYDSGYERALALASAKHDVVPVVLVDPRDASCPTWGSRRSRTWRAGEGVVVDTGRSARARLVRDVDEAHRRARRAAFHKLGLDSVEIETGGSFVRPLRDLFARRAKRIRR